MILSKDVSAVELLEQTFARVDRLNPQINAVIWQDREAAMAEARACDAELIAGRFRGPLHGVPMTVKESFDIAGAPTTWGRPDWVHREIRTDADAVKRYKSAGAILYGKTNVPLNLVEWQSFNAVYGTTSNPWDLARTPGGSSGGSAAALATGLTALELGSDIGSSIRNPAHYCGVFGLKPTWNAISMQGHTPEGWYGDIDIGAGGPLARNAGDLRLAYNLLAGPSRFESSVWKIRTLAEKRKRVSEFRVALMLGDAAAPVDTAYLDALEAFADAIEAAGAVVTRDRWPEIDSEAHFTLYLRMLGAALSFGASDTDVATQEAALVAAPADIQRVQGNRVAGMSLSHRAWLSLDNQRRAARMAFDAFFEDFDVLLTPVCCSPAFLKDEEGPRWQRRIPVNGVDQLENQQLFWSGYSGVVGLPSTVGPMAQIGGLPVGYQAIAGHGCDQVALAFSEAVAREIVDFTPPPLAL